MRQKVSADRLAKFMKSLAHGQRKRARVYLVGGANSLRLMILFQPCPVGKNAALTLVVREQLSFFITTFTGRPWQRSNAAIPPIGET